MIRPHREYEALQGRGKGEEIHIVKLALIGTGNTPLLTMILDGVKDDGILNLSALARRLNCSRSSLLDRINQHGFESAIRHYLNEQRQRKLSKT